MHKLFLLIAFIAFQAGAIPPLSAIQYTLGISSSCGTVLSELLGTGPDPNSLVLRFRDFEISSQLSQSTPLGHLASRECQIRANVLVPPGLKFTPIHVLTDGEVATSEAGWAKARFTYKWHRQEKTMAQHFPSGIQDVFILKSEENYNWPASSCSPYTQTVAVEGHFSLSAAHHDSDLNFSDIALFNAEQRSTMASCWIWQWRYCNPWLNYEYSSQYSRFQKKPIKGKTVLNGFEGFYETKSGERGTLHGIRYSDNYREAQGYWLSADGDSGWFIFFLDADNDEYFSGIWGFGLDTGKSPQGEWSGESI